MFVSKIIVDEMQKIIVSFNDTTIFCSRYILLITYAFHLQ